MEGVAKVFTPESSAGFTQIGILRNKGQITGIDFVDYHRIIKPKNYK